MNSNIQYLGNIITSENDTLKILNSINYTGLSEDSRRANANLFIYNSQDKKIGYYHIGHVLGLPTEVRDNKMVFNYKNEQCNQKTVISLRDSIPKQIFIHCTNSEGDLYAFEK